MTSTTTVGGLVVLWIVNKGAHQGNDFEVSSVFYRTTLIVDVRGVYPFLDQVRVSFSRSGA